MYKAKARRMEPTKDQREQWRSQKKSSFTQYGWRRALCDENYEWNGKRAQPNDEFNETQRKVHIQH